MTVASTRWVLLSPVLAALVFSSAPTQAQICEREGYVRHGVDCPNAERDFTGCCPSAATRAAQRAAARAERAAAARAAQAARDARLRCPREQRAVRGECVCPYGWSRQTAEDLEGEAACRPPGLYGGPMRPFDAETGRPLRWSAETLPVGTLLVDRERVGPREYALCVARGACRPTFDSSPELRVSRASAEAYCAWVGKRLPSAEEWSMLASALGDEGPLWLSAESVGREETGLRCVARGPEVLTAASSELRRRLLASSHPSESATRLYAAALALRQRPAEAAPVLERLHAELAPSLGGREAARIRRWEAAARKEAGQRGAARIAYTHYLDWRRDLDADAETSELAVALGLQPEPESDRVELAVVESTRAVDASGSPGSREAPSEDDGAGPRYFDDGLRTGFAVGLRLGVNDARRNAGLDSGSVPDVGIAGELMVGHGFSGHFIGVGFAGVHSDDIHHIGLDLLARFELARFGPHIAPYLEFGAGVHALRVDRAGEPDRGAAGNLMVGTAIAFRAGWFQMSLGLRGTILISEEALAEPAFALAPVLTLFY